VRWGRWADPSPPSCSSSSLPPCSVSPASDAPTAPAHVGSPALRISHRVAVTSLRWPRRAPSAYPGGNGFFFRLSFSARIRWFTTARVVCLPEVHCSIFHRGTVLFTKTGLFYCCASLFWNCSIACTMWQCPSSPYLSNPSL
jgi:hypothetical protein